MTEYFIRLHVKRTKLEKK